MDHIENLSAGTWIAALDNPNFKGVPLLVKGFSVPFIFVLPFGDEHNPVILDHRQDPITILNQEYVDAVLANRKIRHDESPPAPPRCLVLRGTEREIVALPVVPVAPRTAPPPPPEAEGQVPPPPPPAQEEPEDE